MLNTNGLSDLKYSYGDTDKYLLINKYSGQELQVFGKPILSPDKKRIVAIYGVTHHQINPHTINIIRLDHDKSWVEWSLLPKDWAPQSPNWESPTKIKFLKIDSRSYSTIMSLILKNGKWHLGKWK